MDIKELKNIIADYKKVKSIIYSASKWRNRKTTMICYETEIEAQRAITEINKYKRWKAEKQIKKIKQQEQEITSRQGQIQAQEKQELKKIIEKRTTKQE